MAERFPLIANSSANQIQEIASGDSLNLTGNNVHNAGIITATSFKGSISGGTVAGSTGTFSGDVTVSGNLGVAGTITYEDVARVDATGISTFREGFGVGPLAGIALTAYKDGSIRTSGIITANTYYGSGANLTGIDATKIITGNTQVQTVDTGSDGHVKVLTEGTEKVRVETDGGVGIGTATAGTRRLKVLHDADTPFQIHASASNCYMQLGNNSVDNIYLGATGNSLTLHNAGEKFRIGSAGQLGIGGATYGSSGQVLTSGGASAAPTWATNAGKIVQWKWGDSGGNIINNVNQTWTDTDSFAEMTPTSSSSRMMAIVFGHHDARSPYHVSVQWRIRRTHSPKGSGNSAYYGNDWLTNRGSDLGIYSASNVWNMGTGQSNSTDYQYRVQVVCDSSSPGNVRFHQYCRMLLLEMVNY